MLTCIVVPHYDHTDQFAALLPRLRPHNLPLIVVDDGSPESSFATLQQLLADYDGQATLIRHDINKGKGASVISGFQKAHRSGYTHALQVDADGQHDPCAIDEFLSASRDMPERVICGEPRYFEDVSKLRFYSRYITLWFCWLESLSTEIRDAMCGFRVYPLAATLEVIESGRIGARMTFDSEILVRAIWSGMRLHFVPVDVRYPEGGQSHFRYLRDNIQISWMHLRLITGMLLRLPRLLSR